MILLISTIRGSNLDLQDHVDRPQLSGGGDGGWQNLCHRRLRRRPSYQSRGVRSGRELLDDQTGYDQSQRRFAAEVVNGNLSGGRG